MNNDSQVKVSIRCTTYNHEKYIKECLDSLINQVTSFKYEIIVHDDASTDATASIIRDYAERFPDIIIPIYEKENVFSKDRNLVRKIVTSNCKGQYMAWCEGDDYWCDQYKLQKQVDIMDSDREIGLVYGKSKQYDESKGKFLAKTIGEKVLSSEALLLNNTIPTATVLVRSSIYYEYMKDQEIQNNQWLMGDYPLWIYCSIKSKVFFMDDVISVYRVLRESASHSLVNRQKLESFYESATQMKLFFNDRYKLVDNDIITSQHHELLLYNAASFGDRKSVIDNYCLVVTPSRISRFFYVISRLHLLWLYRLFKLIK